MARLTTWHEMQPLPRSILVVVNSHWHNEDEVSRLFERLRSQDGTALHVVAPPAWRNRVAAEGIGAGHFQAAADAHGNELELNYFLEWPATLRWLASLDIQAVVGTTPHAQYNDYVNDIFEQRVALLLRQGVFLAHTLPQPYVYVFDAAGLLRRMDRLAALDQYRSACKSIVDDCYRLWRVEGSPAVSDRSDRRDVIDVLTTRLGPAILGFDEASPIPLQRPHDNTRLATFVAHLNDAIAERQRLLDERIEAVQIRDDIIKQMGGDHTESLHIRDEIIHEIDVERLQAVGLRDDIIQEVGATREEVARMREQIIREIGTVRVEIAGMRDQIIREIETVRAENTATREEILAEVHRQIEFRISSWLHRVARGQDETPHE